VHLLEVVIYILMKMHGKHSIKFAKYLIFKVFIVECNLSIKLRNHLFPGLCLCHRFSLSLCEELTVEVCPSILYKGVFVQASWRLELGGGEWWVLCPNHFIPGKQNTLTYCVVDWRGAQRWCGLLEAESGRNLTRICLSTRSLNVLLALSKQIFCLCSTLWYRSLFRVMAVSCDKVAKPSYAA
jgi:hypothetical protein